MLDSLSARWPDKVSVLHPVDYFCDAECPVVKNGLWLYNNRSHLSLAGADYMIGRSGDVFRRFIADDEARR
jgi:hypothetical protein